MNERAREHAPYHDRRLEQQTLDALLRIEEQLFAIGKALTARTVITVEEPEDEGEVEIATADLKDGKPSVSLKVKGKRK